VAREPMGDVQPLLEVRLDRELAETFARAESD
jgi:hypothetical protein